jgi:hypothetical protein
MSAGKGDKPRPVDKKTYDVNYDNITWESKGTAQPLVKKGGKITVVYKAK